MKVAIDKDCINKIKDFNEFEYIYIFDDEPLEKLVEINLHCIHKDYIKDADINLSKYEISCYKKDTIDNENWKQIPKIKKNKYAIIVPNYNNDHRRV